MVNSGHPGTPMAMTPVAYCLWQRVLRFDRQENAARSVRAQGAKN